MSASLQNIGAIQPAPHGTDTAPDLPSAPVACLLLAHRFLQLRHKM